MILLLGNVDCNKNMNSVMAHVCNFTFLLGAGFVELVFEQLFVILPLFGSLTIFCSELDNHASICKTGTGR